MSKIVLDEDLRSRLNGLNDETEFCNEQGETVGFFVPADRHREFLYAWARTHVTDEEIEAGRQSGGGRPLSEILAELQDG